MLAVLRNALSMDGMVASLSGPSKSGKTVLIERVVGREYLISVSGARIKTAEDLWNSVLDWMAVPFETKDTSKQTDKKGTEIGASGGLSVFGLGRASATATGKLDSERGTEQHASHRRGGSQQIVKELAGSDFVILVDDFHYIPREMQGDVARQIKDVVREKVKICTATVSHRGDDVLRANSELRGRLQTINLPYWGKPDLVSIAKSGLPKLNVSVSPDTLECLATEAAGSPQLMQLLCLQMCFFLRIREQLPDSTKFPLSQQQLEQIFEQTSAATDFRSLFDVLDCGPKLRGKERKIYSFRDGSSGDVYRCILKGIAGDPPALSFDYDSLIQRTRAVCDGDAPTGSSLSGSCAQMIKLAQEAFPTDRSIDWDVEKEVLDIPDPYLSFYLRWSGRLLEKAN
jgi:hypothetical protein